MNDDRLRSLGPPGLPADRHTVLRAKLMAEITADGPEQAPSRSRRRHLRPVVVAGAVAMVTMTSVAAAAVIAFVRPDPQQAATLLDRSVEVLDAHNPGWRPELQAELVTCTTGNGPHFGAYAADFALDEPIAASDYLAACADKAAQLEVDGGATELCRQGDGPVPEPVVALGGTCDAFGLSAADEPDIAALNEARRVEVALLATEEACPTPAQVAEHARAVLADAPFRLTVMEPAGTARTSLDCYRAFVSWQAGTVAVAEYKLHG